MNFFEKIVITISSGIIGSAITLLFTKEIKRKQINEKINFITFI
jgi:hypothetical protein